MQKRKQWRCPDCGHRFVTRNLWHSCGRYRLKDHFAGRPPELRKIFNQVAAVTRGFGPVTVYAQKTRIVLQARVRFAGVIVRNEWLDVHMWLRRKVEHSLLRRVESFGRLGYGCSFRLRNVSDMDEALARLLQEAYTVNK